MRCYARQESAKRAANPLLFIKTSQKYFNTVHLCRSLSFNSLNSTEIPKEHRDGVHAFLRRIQQPLCPGLKSPRCFLFGNLVPQLLLCRGRMTCGALSRALFHFFQKHRTRHSLLFPISMESSKFSFPEPFSFLLRWETAVLLLFPLRNQSPISYIFILSFSSPEPTIYGKLLSW